MKKQLMFIIAAILVFEPLYFSSALAGKGPAQIRHIRYYPGLKKANYKKRSSFNHTLTKEEREKSKIEQKNTINAACLVLAGMLVILPSFGFLFAALSKGVTEK